MSMDFWNNFWTALGVIASTGISGIAIVLSIKANKQTEKQIELSNKHHLFEKRINIYWEISSLMNVCVKISDFSEIDLIKEVDIDKLLETLTNVDSFSHIYDLQSIKVDKKTGDEIKVLQDYLYDMKKLLIIVKKMMFLFEEGEVTDVVSKFIFSYQDLLETIFDKYQSRNSSQSSEIYSEKIIGHIKDLNSNYQKLIEIEAEKKLKNMTKIF